MTIPLKDIKVGLRKAKSDLPCGHQSIVYDDHCILNTLLKPFPAIITSISFNGKKPLQADDLLDTFSWIIYNVLIRVQILNLFTS
jgi:hypothetical protein